MKGQSVLAALVVLLLLLAGCGQGAPGAATANMPVAVSPPSPTLEFTPSPQMTPNAAATATLAAPVTPAAGTPATGGLAVRSAMLDVTATPSGTPGMTSSSGSSTVTPLAATPLSPDGLPAFTHVFIIVMENHEAGQIVGNSAAPYLNRLASQYGRAANYYGVSHPSLPNYLALTGGDTFGVTTDCTDCLVSADNIANQLAKAGRSWRAYMESMPGPCFQGPAAGRYAQRHNPFIYYDSLRNDLGLCGQIVPLQQLDADLRSGTLPDYAWITPDLCNDMHDCPVSTGDAWLRTWVPKILASPAWQDGGVLFITFDEGTTGDGCCQNATGGKVDMLVVSPLVRAGFVSEIPYSHYSLLRTIEQAWGLPLLGKAGCDCSLPMTDFFSEH